MGAIPEPKNQWYVVHVLSGLEQKVTRDMNRRIASESLDDIVFEVLMPTERVEENRKGKKVETTRKFFPGYIIVNLHLLNEDGGLNDRAWYFIQETNGAIGFAGSRSRGDQTIKPVPMRQSEVDSMLAQIKEREEHVKPKVQFEVGETVQVADGPFEGQTGVVEEVDAEEGKLLVSVNIFGRSTPVELHYWQVERE